MAVSVETLSGLERKVIVSVPAEKIEEEVGLRLLDLVKRVKVHGFRQGKVPLQVVKQRYTESVRDEVARELIQSTLYEALKDNQLTPAGTPSIEPGVITAGQDFSYTALFEVFPEFTIKELEQAEIELSSADITDEDVHALLEKLREQNKQWTSVERPVVEGDRVVIDFEGFMDGQSMENAREKDYELVIGSGTMIDGFESGLIGAQLNVPLELHVTFPEQYQQGSLAGKPAQFKVLVKEIQAGELPELNDAFALLFKINEGGIEALKQDIKENMSRELERRLANMNREKIFDAILAMNTFDVPNVLIEQEIGHLKHDMYHRIFGHEHSEHEKIPDFPRELFLDQATRRVRMGLLFADYVKKHKIEIDRTRVDAFIYKLAEAYDDPSELQAWYQAKPERMAEVEALVMEEMVADKMIENSTIIMKKLSYDEVMTPKQQSQVAIEETGE